MGTSSDLFRDFTVILFSAVTFQICGVVFARVFANFARRCWRSSSSCGLDGREVSGQRLTSSTSKSLSTLEWKWKNTLVSLVHSLITGIGSVLCFYLMPEMAEDLINVYSATAQTLIDMSFGYFVYDSVDMLRFNRTRKSFELLLHHALILACFSIVVSTHLYVGYGTVALFVEVNSVFLHIRQLMQLSNVSKSSGVYRLNRLLNLGTYIVFRITTLAWMTRWVIVNRDAVPLLFYSIGSISLAVITVMSIVLFSRLLKSDFSFHKNSADIR